MPRPQGLITVDSPTPEAYLYEHEGVTRRAMAVLVADFAQILHQLREEAPHSKRDRPTSAFRQADDTKAIEVDTEDPGNVVRIGVRLRLEMEAALTESV